MFGNRRKKRSPKKSDKTFHRAVITGGAGGLGRAFSLLLAAEGTQVLVSDSDLEGAQETAEMIRVAGGDALAFHCDVRSPDAFHALLRASNKFFGIPDLLINNAGVAVTGAFRDISLEDWRWVMEINLWGVIHGSRTFTPMMQVQGFGHIINVASAAGLLCASGMSPYNVTKAGVVALSETLHAELQSSGVGVTVLCPMFFRTNIMSSGRGTTHPNLNKFVAGQMDRSPLQADDIARIALEDARRGALYSIPMNDGRFYWYLKRIAPTLFTRLSGKMIQWQKNKAYETPIGR